METDTLDVHGIQRREGSVGLVIFERDDLLLRHRPKVEDQTLGDIDTKFLAMLQDMRDLNVRFGFISYHTASPFDRGARIDNATLTRLLDDLLKVSGAVPDFWMEAIHSPSQDQTRHWPGTSDLYVISELTKRYEVDPTMTVVVRKGNFARFSKKTPTFTEVHYPGPSAADSSEIDTQTTMVWLKMTIKHALKLP